MKLEDFCQSCGMPLHGVDLWGTEKDGTKTHQYCKYCYEEGLFTQPGITMEEMREQIIEKMEKQKIPADIIETTVCRLPYLNRWKSQVEA